jgi:transcriptional regulator with XRE-family HTH domain
MLEQLAKAGIKQHEITSKTGIKRSYLSRIKNESIGSDHFDQAINLLDLYLITINQNPPRVGDYFEF